MRVEIPVLEHDDLLSDDVVARSRAADAVRRAFSGPGLIFVHGAPVARTQVDGLYERFLEVLARPTAEKAGWGGADIWFQRGWTPPNTERAVEGGGEPDFKECFFATPEVLDPEAALLWPELYAENVWPDDADAFRQATTDVGQALHGVGLRLLEACERALDLAPGTLVDLTRGAANITRLLEYLPLDAAQAARRNKILWGEEHTDFNLLTLLPGGRFFRDGVPGSPADGGGLYLRTRPTPEHPAGQRIEGTAPPGCLVAQVGQQLEVLTGGTFLATPHGIVAPAEPGWIRTSVAHFVHVHARTVMQPLPPFANAAPTYGPPVLAGTYATKTLVDIGLAPPTALDQLGYRHYDRLSRLRDLERG
ncbi:MAG: isopenicillin N synthase family oxygenase [Myxococcales bacterium]|nr:isopenicillin N synthase family oxygenase [Myxococcales bacterium]